MDQSNSESLSAFDDKLPPFNRTVCACANCKACCKRQPGSLANGDLERIAAFLKISVAEAAKKYFCASPGALVRDCATGRTMRIGSICPKTKGSRCVFLDQNDRCTIHPVAPFGCAYFDTHMPPSVAQPRSVYLATSHTAPEYQAQRNKLDYATSYRPTKY